MKRYFTILILLCLLTASCGIFGSERSAKNLVTRADAEKLMSMPMKLDLEKSAPKQTSCRYRSADGVSIGFVQVTVQEYETEDQTKDAYESVRDINRHYFNLRTVEGVGDAAWVENNEYSQTIYVRRKNVVFLIDADHSGDREEHFDELRSLAERVAARL